MNNFNEFSTTSESDSEYLVDSRYCRTTVKCKRKALKKTIKLIHGRCVVIYRGSGELLPIAAKDADRNCYSDFVFLCHEPRQIRKNSSIIPQSKSISTSDDDHHPYEKHLSEQNSFSFKTNNNNNNNNNENTESIIQQMNTNDKYSQFIFDEIDVNIDELIQHNQPTTSIIYYPSINIKSPSMK